MGGLLLTVAVFLLVNVLVSLIRLVRGPTPADRLIATLLFGTTGVGLLVVLADIASLSALRDVALVLALLAGVLSASFTSRAARVDNRGTDERSR
jgi:multicomponent Na+:H+ antiporter subunit F